MAEKKQMFRCTYPLAYGPGTPGFSDVTARQGHYIEAVDAEMAANKAFDARVPYKCLVDVQETGSHKYSRYLRWALPIGHMASCIWGPEG